MSKGTLAQPAAGQHAMALRGMLSRAPWAIPMVLLASIIAYPLGELFAVLVKDGMQAFEILLSPRIAKVLLNTLRYTVVSTGWALVFGLPLAWVLSRNDDPTTAAARGLIALGFVLPEFIYAIAYVFLLDPNTGYITRMVKLALPDVRMPLYGLAGMSLITGFFCVPQIVMLVEPALRNVSSDLEEAAEVGGSSTLNTMLRITLPLVLPAVLTAALLTFLLAFASFGIPAALGVPVNFYVLSTEVYSVVSTYPPRFDTAAVLSLVFLLVSLVVIVGQMLATRTAIRFRTIGGKGFRRRHLTRSPLVRAVRLFFVWLMVALVSLLPLAIVIAASFVERWWQIPGAVTLKHYFFVLRQDPLFPEIASTTASVTFLTVVTSLALALALGVFVSTRRQGPAAWLVRLLGYVALSVPPIAFTIGALLAYVKPPLELYGTIWILVVTYCARFYPLAAGPISDGLTQLDPALSESALVGGAGAWRTFVQIQLPLIRPVVIAAALIVMMFTMRELLSAVFLQSSQVKMAMVAVFNYWDEGNLERAAAMSSVIVFVCACGFFIANRVQSGALWRHGR